MGDRTKLLEVALDSLPEGVALLDEQDHVAFWNRAAETITGYACAEITARPLPAALESLTSGGNCAPEQADEDRQDRDRGAMTRVQHRLGHELRVVVRTRLLRDQLDGARIGTAMAFHSASSAETLPHDEYSESDENADHGEAFEEQLNLEFEDFARTGLPLGVLCITVDQAIELRRTHGNNAYGAMLEKVLRAMAQGLRATEKIDWWGNDGFLVISHEPALDALAAHAQTLARLARTVDFRWWGDRLSLTVSIGAAQAWRNGTLDDLLKRAQTAMLASFYAGGNRITPAPGGHSCLPS
jgi:diguanylate cyclase (GGDEF)-like protein/PAS domain S-box-containing protein